jgi:N-acetylglutamate synthase-like GNAT family acetyltransferase
MTRENKLLDTKIEYLAYLAKYSANIVSVLDNEDISAFVTQSYKTASSSIYTSFNHGVIKPNDNEESLIALQKHINLVTSILAKDKIPFVMFLAEDKLQSEKHKLLRRNRFISLGKTSLLSSRLGENELVVEYAKGILEKPGFDIYEINGDDDRFRASDALWFRFCKILAESSEGTDSKRATLIESLFSKVECGPEERFRAFIGTIDNGKKIVATSTLFYSGNQGGVHNVCVLAPYRKKKYGSLMVLHCMAQSLRDGKEVCVVQPNQNSDIMFKKLGFTPSVSGRLFVHAHNVSAYTKAASWLISNRFSLWYFGEDSLNQILQKISTITFRVVVGLLLFSFILVITLVVIKMQQK